MKQCVPLLCGVMMLSLSVNIDAVENEVAMVSAQAMHDVDVGHRLQERQLSQNAVSDALLASADRINQPAEPPSGMDLWLMALAGAGLIVLQLRRKQKSLPQRPLIPTDKSNGGLHAQRHTDVVVNFASHS